MMSSLIKPCKGLAALGVKQIILILVGGVLVFSAVIAGGIYFVNKPAPVEFFEFTEAGVDEKNNAPEHGSNAEPDHNDSPTKREDDLTTFVRAPFFNLPLIIVPVIRDGKVIATLHFRVTMKATGRTSFERCKILLPQLVDGIFSDIYKSFENLWILHSTPSPAVIKERIFYVTEKILGKGHVESIFLKKFFFNLANE